MPATLARAPAAPRDYSACSGCSLCLLVCPMWRSHHDPRLTPEGLTKALQCGATVLMAEVAAPVEACSLCGACDPVCPEGIDLSGLIMDLRRKLPGTSRGRVEPLNSPVVAAPASSSAVLLLPGPELRADSAALAQIQALLGTTIADDDGADIALALETGGEISPARLQQFLTPLHGRQIVATDGLLLHQLRRWLPGSRRMGLGPALSSRAPVRSQILPSDLYVIEPRAFHADYERMVISYDRLQQETGCSFNLDLQRIAIPATIRNLAQSADDNEVQARWILQGRKPARIVVERAADAAAFKRVCDIPVVNLADLGVDPTMIKKLPHAFG